MRDTYIQKEIKITDGNLTLSHISMPSVIFISYVIYLLFVFYLLVSFGLFVCLLALFCFLFVHFIPSQRL